MDGDIKNFTAVSVTAAASLCYCYILSRRVPTGAARLISMLPVICAFTLLPLCFSFTPLVGPTAFLLSWLANFKLLLLCFSFTPLVGPTAFLLSWLANFKLLLLAAGIGPLSSPNLPLPQFLAVAALPIIPLSGYKLAPSPTSIQFPVTPSRSAMASAKFLVLGAMLSIHDRRPRLSDAVLWGIYCCQVYLAVELLLAFGSAVAWVALGLESEPQFRDPYLATSLQDFWGRRWNLTVPSILRDAVHRPVRRVCEPVVGRAGGQAAGLVATFLVSGLMHELIFFYLTRARPTWEVTLFFVVQGACTAAEAAVKWAAAAAAVRLPAVVSRVLTLGFVAVTVKWLFLPQITREGTHVLKL